jgi:NAD(P)H-nitrite reductase large subunit
MRKNREDLGAIWQNNDRFGIAPHLPGGIVTAAELRKLADVAERFGSDVCKVTSAQRIAIIGIDENRIEEAWNELGMAPGAAIGLCVRSIKMCPGNRYCPYGQQDTIEAGLEMDRRFHGRKLPAKFKIAVSGCTRQCSENCIRDFGMMGFKDGWKITVGGNGGAAPRLALPLIKNLSDEQAITLCEKICDLMIAENVSMRIGKWIEKIGLDTFKRTLGLPTEA